MPDGGKRRGACWLLLITRSRPANYFPREDLGRLQRSAPSNQELGLCLSEQRAGARDLNWVLRESSKGVATLSLVERGSVEG